MRKVILEILAFILNLQKGYFSKKHAALEASNESCVSFKNSDAKNYMNANESLSITSKLDERKTKMDNRIRAIVKQNIKTPEKLLEFVKLNGTRVYKIKFANKILAAIGETEGLILPLRGFRALYLNWITAKKISFNSSEMFVLRDLPVSTYIMLHQFHKWYGFKMQLPGFEERAVELFRNIGNVANAQNIATMRYSDIMSLKDAVRRDIEAIDFVLKLSRENEGAQFALENIKKGSGAKI